MSIAVETTSRARADVGGWEPAAAALCLAQLSEPLFAAIAQSQGLADPPGYARVLFLPVYGFLAFVIWRDRASALAALRATPLLTALLGLAAVSALWSIDSGATIRRAVWLAATMALGFYLAWRYRWRELALVIAGAFALLIAASFATSLLAPAVGRMTFEHPGAWSGLWTHKNTLGGFMALGLPACIAAAWLDARHRWLWALAALGAFALVLLSTSKTALLASVLGAAVIGGGALMRRGPMPALLTIAAAAVAVIAAFAIAWLAPDFLVAAIGRDLTLTGRTEIWEAAARFVEAKPWLGYGYYAFWLPDNGPAYWVREAVNWQVASAHSGWLELALGLGRAGVVLFALQLAGVLRRGAGAVFRPDSGLYAPALLAVFALYTLSESHVLQANDLFWAVYVAVGARLALDAKEAA